MRFVLYFVPVDPTVERTLLGRFEKKEEAQDVIDLLCDDPDPMYEPERFTIEEIA